MTPTVRDAVDRGFTLLAEGLGTFVKRVVQAATQGDWLEQLKNRERNPSGKTYHRGDPLLLLRAMVEEEEAFRRVLSRPERRYAQELKDIRHDWAHFTSLTPDDALRALDSMERLLSAADATKQRDEVQRLRLDLQQSYYQEQARRSAEAGLVSHVAGTGLSPWREVVTPRQEVAGGRFTLSDFAASLYRVAAGDRRLGEEYRDPAVFFRRTYLTDGLRGLLERAVRRLAGDETASPVVNLQTNFGGGKTHALLALYHLCSGQPAATYPPEVQELLAGRELPPQVRRVALVGNELTPAEVDVKEDGARVHTLWGELAWQLGGRPAYRLVEAADRAATNPGKALRRLIDAYAPCLILIDEWVAYARQLYGREERIPAGDFDTQFTFAQTLTEVVASTSGALLVISIPASDAASGADAEATGASEEEIGGPYGQEALRRLQNVVRRVADPWRPASVQEAFEIVRRRLFEPPQERALQDIGAVAKQFVRFYSGHRGEFPRECGELPYEERIAAAYPIHPELFDRLYGDWSTLDRFQRTRGVLRLMSTVVHSLWATGDPGPLILSGSVPLHMPLVNTEITQYLPENWKPVIDTDVDGPGATPARVDADRSNLGRRHLTRRIARAIFVGSAPTLGSANKGLDRRRLWLGVAMPGDTVGNFGSALELLSQRATYLYTGDSRYWYDTQASVARTARDHAERLREEPEKVWRELVRRLGGEGGSRGEFAMVRVCPEADRVPDTEEATLVILHPSLAHGPGGGTSPAYELAQRFLDHHREGAPRVNRNMVVFLAPDARRRPDLEQAAREWLAWNDICHRAVAMNLSPHQQATAQDRLRQADDAVRQRILATYSWALVPQQADFDRECTLEAVRMEGSSERLAERASARLRREGHLASGYSPANIRLELDRLPHSPWQRHGHIRVGEVWSYYCRYPYLTRLRDWGVLADAVSSVLALGNWQEEGFALAEGVDADRYRRLTLPGEGDFGEITDTTLLVHPEQALRQREEPEVGEDAPPPYPAEPGGAPAPAPAPPPEPPPPANVRFAGVVRVASQRYGRDLSRIADEVLAHLAGEGADLEVTVEVTATMPGGFPEEKVRIVSENARTLDFDRFGFEDG